MADLRATGERIDALIDALATVQAGPPAPAASQRAREQAEELVRVVTDLYGAGIERILDIAYDSGRLDDELLGLLAQDDLVASLLLVHGLHPEDVHTRVQKALDAVRPYLGSHGGDVELLEVTDEGAVHLRLLGSCDGCPSSSVTLELAVRDAIESAAPEVVAIEVDAPSTHDADPVAALIPVESLRTRLDTRSAGGRLPGGRRRLAPAGRGRRSAARAGDDDHRGRRRALRLPGRCAAVRVPRRLRPLRAHPRRHAAGATPGRCC